MREHFADFIGHRKCIFEHHLLWKISYGYVGWHSNRSSGRLLQTGDNLQHRALARAVFPHQGNLVLGVYHIINIVEEQL